MATTTNLPSTQNSRTIERQIRRFCRAQGYRGDLVFEHGHWWLTLPNGAIFAVVDTADGFGLEQVSDGRER